MFRLYLTGSHVTQALKFDFLLILGISRVTGCCGNSPQFRTEGTRVLQGGSGLRGLYLHTELGAVEQTAPTGLREARPGEPRRAPPDSLKGNHLIQERNVP